MEKDLVSIIVPCYNASRYLNDVFLSIKNQTYQNIEVVFVDDGSTDETGKMLDNFAQSYSKAKVVHKVNGGPSSARNAGIAAARGTYIYFMDSDDIIHPMTLNYCIDIYKKNNVDLVWFSSVRFSENRNYDSFAFKTNFSRKEKLVSGLDDVYVSFLSNVADRSVYCKLFKHSLIRKMANYPNVFDEKCFYSEDMLFLCSLYQKCSTVMLLKARFYCYRIAKGSLMRSSYKVTDFTVFKSEAVLNDLDPNTYKTSVNYVPSLVCFAAMDLIRKLNHSNYDNPKVVKEIYHRYRDNLKYLPKLTRLTWPYRFGTLFTLPIMYLMVRKKLKG